MRIQELEEYLKSKNEYIRKIQPLNTNIEGVVGIGTRKCLLLKCLDLRPDVGSNFIVKAGKVGTKAGDEVRKNFEAYDFSKSLGVDVIPGFFFFETYKGINILEMQPGWYNFIKAARENREPVLLYEDLASRLEENYNRTLRPDKEQAIRFVKQKLADQKRYFESYLIPEGLVDRDVVTRLEAIDAERLAPEGITWTTGGELVPEHVCFGRGGLFIIDPRGKDELLGLPQIDLAMFAVLSRDIYQLPRGKEGYEILKVLSNKTAKLQGAGKSVADALWSLGEMRQYSLSSRFRIGKENERAAKYANTAQKKLSELEEKLLEVGQ